jgi:hypothetical protein
MPAVAVDFSPKWEFNFGVGLGVTQGTDCWVIKAILGCRFNLKQNWRRRNPLSRSAPHDKAQEQQCDDDARHQRGSWVKPAQACDQP